MYFANLQPYLQMMSDIQRLALMQAKPSKLILGLMSGTSIDGLDVALCEFRGHGKTTSYQVHHHGTIAYSNEQRAVLKHLASSDSVSMQDLCMYHTQLSYWHSEIVLRLLEEWDVSPQEVDLIASHGQTIRHAPKRIHMQSLMPNSTFQLGEADHLARLTGIITISDFRQKHVSAGGEGAPLAVYGDQILFSDSTENRVLVNIGGIANITVLKSLNGGTDQNTEIVLPLTFDTGPGNTLMDQAIGRYFSPLRYDEGGRIAASGTVNDNLLDALCDDTYFRSRPPKTTGPEYFSETFLDQRLHHLGLVVGSGIDKGEISGRDLLSTLCEMSAVTLCDAIKSSIGTNKNNVVYVSGGGVHNKTLMSRISTLLRDIPVKPFSDLGVDPDAKEALFFAALANELLHGTRFPVLNDSGRYEYASFGKISLPS